MVNFNNPYVSASFQEFWKRWHISLSSWFKDYLYIPLGGNRVKVRRHYFNLIFTFLIAGLWHGSNWTFLAWGLLNGLYLIVADLTKEARGKFAAVVGLDRYPLFHHSLKVLSVFSLTCLGWIFFRAKSLGDAFYILQHMWGPSRKLDVFPQALVGLSDMGWNPYFGPFLIVMILSVQLFQNRLRDKSFPEWLSSRTSWSRWGTYYLLFLSIFLALVFSLAGPKQFLYFQF